LDEDWRIAWRPKALSDLRAILLTIERDNPTRARSFGAEFRKKVDRLARHPELGRPGRPGLKQGMRELVVHPRYIVFYRLKVKTRTVEIQQVKHTAQRFP